MSISVAEVLSRWSYTFPNFAMSSDKFYAKLEVALKECEMPDTKIERTTHKEGGMFSSSREYLRAKHKDLVFDICAAPFGKDFFISWWLYQAESKWAGLLKNTKIGDFLQERAARRTFFEADKEAMFRNAVHNVVLGIVEKIDEGTGKRQLTSEERAVQEGGL